jgi:hypothetical protein
MTYKEKVREGTKGRAILRNLGKKEFRETNKQIKSHTALPHVNTKTHNFIPN